MKNKLLSAAFGTIGLFIVLATLYYTITYTSYIGGVVIEFLSTNNVQEITDCGVVVPSEFMDIRDQFPSTLLPIIYLGLPVILLLISVSLFLSGYFYGKHTNELEGEMRSEGKKKAHPKQ
ncbi:hypothetical protein JW721_02965 [Candidatus Micrarchaeota archaeon]|nr:hypothetical protein [Candidatus Micrarchaeota archaeon]